MDTAALYRSNGIIDLITDFAIFIIPMRPIWSLQMSLKKKLPVFGVFAIGAM